MIENKVWWREKGTKRWIEGWVIGGVGSKLKLGDYNGSSHGVWYDRRDIEIQERP